MGRAGAFKDRPLWRRLQAIHHEIKEGRRPNTSSLAEKLSVSSKTVQRDIEYLRDELAAPLEFDRESNGYRYSRSDYVLPFLPVDGKDLFSIGVAAQVFALFGGTPLARDLKACYERLARLMPPAVRLRPEIVMEKLALRASFRPVREQTWEAVSEAMQRGVVLSIRYHRPGAPLEGPRLVRPYAFVLSGRDWMMLAEDEASGVVKSFYLARIEEAILTDRRYVIPRNFDADAFFRDTFGLFVGGGRPFRFRIRFSRSISDDIREQQWHPNQKIESAPEGQVILELPARSIAEARRFVLQYGDDATVLSPPELVKGVFEQAKALARRYGGREAEGGRRKAGGGGRSRSADKT
jgi:predicted DNA-binding transcriptional regulator YafY